MRWKDRVPYWKSWFAWRPVYVVQGEWVWLERVERIKAPPENWADGWHWHYRNLVLEEQ